MYHVCVDYSSPLCKMLMINLILVDCSEGLPQHYMRRYPSGVDLLPKRSVPNPKAFSFLDISLGVAIKKFMSITLRISHFREREIL